MLSNYSESANENAACYSESGMDLVNQSDWVVAVSESLCADVLTNFLEMALYIFL